MKKFFTKNINVCLIATLCCALWGSAFPVIKMGYAMLEIPADEPQSQILFAGVRFALAGLFTIILGSIFADKVLVIKKKSVPYALILALFQTVLQYLFFYIGLANTTGTKSSILDSLSVFFAVIISAAVLKQEKLDASKIIGCVIGFVGVVIVNVTPNANYELDFSFKGEGFIMLSALSYAISSVLIKQFSAKENPVTLSGYQFLIGGIVMALAGLIAGGRFHISSAAGVCVIIYLALLSAAAYTLWGLLLKYNPVSKVSVFGFMTPVFGCILSAIVLKEKIARNPWMTVVAVAVVCVGIIVVNGGGEIKDVLRRIKEKKTVKPSEDE